jgi:Lhr-like helicase
MSELSEDQVRELDAKLKGARADACMQEIAKSLEKHRCELIFKETRVNGEVVQKAFTANALD